MSEETLSISASQFKTMELVIQELQNRLGQVTTQYEMNLAVLKAQATQEIENKDKQIAELMHGRMAQDVSQENN